jgi:hypothetical protein
MAGYSGTPLARKLGLKAAAPSLSIGARRTTRASSRRHPRSADRRRVASTTDIVHIFSTAASGARAFLAKLPLEAQAEAAIWVSWPKKSAKVPTDITEDVIREVALPLGFVDVKVCAVSDVWSGLKLVLRKELR